MEKENKNRLIFTPAQLHKCAGVNGKIANLILINYKKMIDLVLQKLAVLIQLPL